MPLTPADVHNVAFSKPPIGKRGYNEDEVDAFLDLIETELSRLIEENADLRQRVSELDSELAGARSGSGQAEVIPFRAPEPAVAVVAEEPNTAFNEEQAGKAEIHLLARMAVGVGVIPVGAGAVAHFELVAIALAPPDRKARMPVHGVGDVQAVPVHGARLVQPVDEIDADFLAAPQAQDRAQVAVG